MPRIESQTLPKPSQGKVKPNLNPGSKAASSDPQVKPPKQAQAVVATKPEGLTRLSRESSVIISFTDAILRGVFRWFETRFNQNQPLRIGYRLGTELIRKGAEGSFGRLIDGRKISLEDAKVWTSRAVENTVGSAVIEPNRFNLPMKIVAGFSNFMVRLASRGALYAGKFTSRESIGNARTISEEAFSRTLFRSISSRSENPFIGTAVRIFEQLAINLNLHFGKLLNRGINLVSGQSSDILHNTQITNEYSEVVL